MKYSDLSSKTQSLCQWTNFAAASLLAAVLAGCGGGGGGGGTPAAAPAAAAPGVAAPTGAAPITLTATTPAATFAALSPVITVGSVSIASPPTVSFSVTDGVGNAIIGLGSKSQTATATVAQYPNFAFALAKLIPGTPIVSTATTTPSRWVNYIVTTVPTKNATTGIVTASVPTRPTTDNTGTLVDFGNGTYTYTFFRDITAVKAQVAAATLTAPNLAADLDDLTFDPTLVHRLTIQLSGNAPGTGNNTPDGVTLIPAVVMANPVNAIFDFVPATGTQVATTASGRDIVATAKCNECHLNLGGFPDASAADSDATFHGGNRNKIEYCVVCHTDQRKYGRAEAVVVANATNGGNYDGANTYRINTLGVGNLKTHIHKIHMSENLTKTGYNYGGIAYETACKFPQDIRNCTKCHDGSATSTAQTAQGDNWMKVPNRAACGACHDGINFEGTATIGINGTGQTLADFKAGVTTGGSGHIGGIRHDDTQCALCHDATTIPVNHIPVTPPGADNSLLLGGTNANTNAASIASNTSRLPAGAIKVTYEISSVSLDANRHPLMVFRLLQNGVAVPFNVFVPPASSSKEIWDNFMGAPSVYFVYAVAQDGIAAPADFNASASTYLRSLWNGTASGAAAGTLTGPDASGFYTATITGSTVPAGAGMLTGGLGYSYNVRSSLPLTQTNLADFPTAPSVATTPALTPNMPNKTGGLIVIVPNVQKVATGFTGRRPIVEDARCNRCHQELGTFTEDAFHAGQRNDGTTCAWCHNPNKTSSGWAADSTSFIHSIHAAAKRTVPYTWHAASKADGFFTIGYPGILSNCETCHLPSTFDFSAPASASALPNRLYRTSAAGAITTDFTTSPEVTALIAAQVPASTSRTFGAAFAVDANGVPTTAANAGAAGTLVNSPIATVCFSCHTDTLAIAHMKSNGGSLYVDRTTALATVEQCTLCHLAGRVADIKVVHQP